MDLSTAYRYNQNMMEYYTCKLIGFVNIWKYKFRAIIEIYLIYL